MGLFLAKEYIKSEKKTDDVPFVLHYNGSTRILKRGERYFFPDDDFLEIIYTGDEINFTYCSEERFVSKYENNILTFTVIESITDKFERKNIVYPLMDSCSAVHVIRYSSKEYENSRKNVLTRYMEYRD